MIESITLGNFEQKSTLSKDCSLLRLSGGSDDNAMTVYTVFPGIFVMYSSFHTQLCTTQFSYANRTISIDHCSEGRIEWEHADGSFSYLGETDCLLSARGTHTGTYGFPTGHYHGITIQFSLDDARESLRQLDGVFQLDIDPLHLRFAQLQEDLILRSDPGIEHLFAELYVVQEEVRMSYLRLKVLELLLYLSRLDLEEQHRRPPYFQRSVVEKVRCIKQDLCLHPDRRQTLSALAAQYDLSESALKRCFQAMYGDSPYAFAKQHRLQNGMRLLRTTQLSITEIGIDIGYENTSKFIAAFKKQFGVTPAKYRAAM